MVVRTAAVLVLQSDMAVEAIIPLLVQRLRRSLPNVFIQHQQNVTSQRHWIEEIIRRWCDEDEIDLILTLGGTFPAPGPSEAEVVPEASIAVIERMTPALPELMRSRAMTIDSRAILDRGVAGIRGRTLIVNLPGDPNLTSLFLEVGADAIASILQHLHLGHDSDEDNIANNAAPPSSRKLNAEEFARFLHERQNRKRR